jgi:hypothetical protein
MDRQMLQAITKESIENAFAIADQPGLCLIVALSGTDSTGTSRGLSNVDVTISDTTNAYIADAGLSLAAVYHSAAERGYRRGK